MWKEAVWTKMITMKDHDLNNRVIVLLLMKVAMKAVMSS